MNTKLRCLLLDDELPGLTYLKMLCEQIPQLEVVKAFNNPDFFLRELPELEFDICILDIEMPGINGLQVARMLEGKPVIFTTAYKDYAAEAFDLNAIDYVRKPVTMHRLQQAIHKAIHYIEKEPAAKKYVQLNTDKGKTRLIFDQLFFIKASDIDSRDKVAYLDDGSSFTLKNVTFGRLQKLLPAKQFCRINKREIMALKFVQTFSFNEITSTVYNGTGKIQQFMLSEVYRQEFISKVSG